MREKDLRQLYECEFPIMERLITEKDVFQKRLEQKPIMVVTQGATKEQKDEVSETFWRTGVYRPMGYDEIDEFGFNVIVTHCIRKRYGANAFGNHYDTISKGDMFNIPMNEWKRRYDDWVTKINK